MKETIIAALLGTISGYELVNRADMQHYYRHHNQHNHHFADDYDEDQGQRFMQIDSLKTVKPDFHREVKGI
jgi:hypothetical protein